MQLPFPGMDPYIEVGKSWGDFHQHLIEGIFNGVSERLPKGYVARVGERSYIALVESEEKTERHFEPDVGITAERERRAARVKNGGAATATLEADRELCHRGDPPFSSGRARHAAGAMCFAPRGDRPRTVPDRAGRKLPQGACCRQERWPRISHAP